MGSAATALVAWLRARSVAGSLVLRIEDIDTPRIVRGCEAAQIEDLRWLGLDWDEGPDVGGPHLPYRQSERTRLYEAAIEKLASQGLVYLCDCSRREIAGIASAPHPGDEGPRYPGTCRAFGMRDRAWKRPPAMRLALPDRETVIDDEIQGSLRQHVGREVGDFVLKRGDGVYAYQLAVVVDDLAMGITEIVRGADLLGSAPRQKLLAEMLGGSAARFAHTPLVLDPEGARLEKRNPRHTLRGQRQLGVSPRVVVARIAQALGLLAEGTEAAPRQLAASFDRMGLRGQREIRLARLLDDG